MMLDPCLGLNETRACLEKDAGVVFERVKQLQLRILLRWIGKVDPTQVGNLHFVVCVVVTTSGE